VRWENVFLADDRLRPIWRFFLSLPTIFLALFVAGQVQYFIFGRQPFPLNLLGMTLLTFPALLAAFKLLTGVFDGRPLRTVGLAFCGRWLRELGLGLLIGAVMILLVAALEGILGVVRFTPGGVPPARLWHWAGGVLLFGFVAATNEELIFRGYPFQRLVEVVGPIIAVGLCSALFGIVHLGNPHHTWISTLNTALVGIPLAVAYLRTRLLWLPIGIHFAWNFVQGFFLGMPVSGVQLPSPLLRAEVSANPLLTGGSYGPEASLLTTAVVILAAGYLGFARSIYMSEETKALVFAPAAKPDLPETSLRLDAESRETAGDPPRMN
jgi:membrane protease YdiL (CAAX protease family)